MRSAVLLTIMFVFTAVSASFAAEKPKKHMFFSNPEHPALLPDEEFDEGALTAPFQPPVMTPMEPVGYTMEDLQERIRDIYNEVDDLPVPLQEIAVEKIFTNMTLEEIVSYKGPIISRRGGTRTFLGKPLR